MNRRELITLLSGATVARPLVARAEADDRTHPSASLAASETIRTDVGDASFRLELERLGWKDGRNIPIVCRWARSPPERAPIAEEFVSSRPQSRP